MMGIQNTYVEAKIEAWRDKEKGGGVEMLRMFREQSGFLLAEEIHSDTLCGPFKIGVFDQFLRKEDFPSIGEIVSKANE